MRTWENCGEETKILSARLDCVEDWNDCLHVFADFLNVNPARVPIAITWSTESAQLVYTEPLES